MTIDFPSVAPAGSGAAAKARRPERLRRVGFSDRVYGEAMDFLIAEAHLLDEDRLEAWLEVLTPDVFYWAPVRTTVGKKRGDGFDSGMAFLFETLPSLTMRVHRNTRSESAYAEDPVSRTRRLIGGLMLHTTEDPDEFAADTSLLLVRNRGDEPVFDQLSARREDILRRTPQGWRLAQRTILMDQAVLGTANLAIFL